MYVVCRSGPRPPPQHAHAHAWVTQLQCLTRPLAASPRQIPSACRFIHEQLRISAPPFSTDDDPAGSAKPGGRVLVQCRSGNQQAAIVVMAYMIVKMGFAPWKALNVCAYARPQVRAFV